MIDDPPEGRSPVASGFDWDAGNWPKCGKHGLTKADIEAVFANTPSVFSDPAHSTAETRFIAIGETRSGRSVFVSFTLRKFDGRPYIRPISARFMRAREVKRYDRAQTQTPAKPENG